MDKRPRIAVITPTKNRLKLLCEAMDSVQQQSFADWEHVVVDDGSNDGTAEEVGRRATVDPRVRFVERGGEKSGANVCRNLGIRYSRADLIVFLDSDDLLSPDSLGRRVDVMDRNRDVDFVTFQTGVFETVPGDLKRQLDADLSGDDLVRFLFFECPWQTTAPTWRRTTLERVGGLDELLPSWQDIDLHIRAIAGGCRYLRFPEVDHHFRWQPDADRISVEQRRSPRHLEAASLLVAKFEVTVRQGPGMNWSRQRALCSLYFFVAECWLAAGNLSSALQSWEQIRKRRLGSRALHLSGAALLVSQALGGPSRQSEGALRTNGKGGCVSEPTLNWSRGDDAGSPPWLRVHRCFVA